MSPYLFAPISAICRLVDICFSFILCFIAIHWNSIPILSTIWKQCLFIFLFLQLLLIFILLFVIFLRFDHFALHLCFIECKTIVIWLCFIRSFFIQSYQFFNFSITLLILIFFICSFWYLHPFYSLFKYFKYFIYFYYWNWFVILKVLLIFNLFMIITFPFFAYTMLTSCQSPFFINYYPYLDHCFYITLEF